MGSITPQPQSNTDYFNNNQKYGIKAAINNMISPYLQPSFNFNSGYFNSTLNNTGLSQITKTKLISPVINNEMNTFRGIKNEKTNNIFKSGKLLGMDMSTWGQIADVGRSLLPESSMYSGEEGNLARGLDSAYDAASNAIAAVPGWGTAASAIMKAGALVNQGINALGGGTDGMTKTDAILNSNFLGLTPLGLINGFAGSRADKYSRDSLIDAETNGSYGGFLNLEDESDKVSGKKYGLFSQGAKNTANNLVQKTTAQQISLGNIEDTNRTNLMAAQGNTPFISNRIQLDYSGGVRQAQVGREGLKFAKRVISKAKVKKVLDESTNKTVTIPTDLSKDQKMGREPITTTDGKAVYMTGDGNVISKIKKAQEGGSIKSNTRSLEELIEYAKQENPEFIQRMNNSPITVGFVDSRKPNIPLFGTHYMTQMDNIVFPTILPINGKMTYIDDPKEAFGIAYNTNNYLAFDSPEEATLFATQYKKGWPDFFKKHEEQGNGHTNFWDIPEGSMTASQHVYFKDGGKPYPRMIQSKEAYYDPSTNTIYYTNDESKTHEYNHFSPNYQLIDQIGDYYKNLTDYKIQKLGGDLNFVKRTGDPNNFYSPEELAARLVTALKMSEGNKYTKDFFKTLRQDENKYGDNMRDLLHMYNDDNLVKLFEITNKYNRENPLEVQTFLNSYKDGGKVNVIPEGALHAHKHHLEEVDEKFEDVTNKGIPVVTESKDGGLVQQAEVEKEEIIFRLDVTKKLEELKKKGTDEAAIEAGKLLVHEILHNTVDNADLIEKTN